MSMSETFHPWEPQTMNEIQRELWLEYAEEATEGMSEEEAAYIWAELNTPPAEMVDEPFPEFDPESLPF
jgi:hypothetical protein